MFDSASCILMIQGHPETVYDNDDFASLLDERLGPDAAEYFQNALAQALLNSDEEE